MQKMLNLLAVLLMIFCFVSCSSSKSQNDSDSIPDSDTDTQDSETLVDEDADKDADPIEDYDKTPDADQDFDSDNDSDAPETVECLDLRYNENTIKTPFPFKDANGKPTFCRPGCDTPTENDPQCVRNIWEWDNWDEYQVYLKAQEKDPNQQKERECYPWPCKLPDMHPKTKETLDTFVSSCDRLLTVHKFKVSSGTIWSHGMSDGVAGMDFHHSGRIVEYDPEKNEYMALGQNRDLAFNEGRYVVEVYDRLPGDNPDTYRTYTISVLRMENGYFYELIRDNYGQKDEFLRPPFAGKNWALLRLTSKTVYASSKDWVWHELAGINNYAGEGNIVGDHLTFITNNRELYYCDLRKYPKHIDECFKLNRKDESGNEELGHSPRIDVDNEYRVVYNVYGTPKFVEVDLKDLSNPKYTEYKIEKKHQNAADWEIDMLKGNRISYSEMIGTLDWFGCFYRFDKQKSYCQTENNFSTDPANLMGYNVFWGKWHLWKEIGRTFAIMRDWECYCEENNVCPLESATEEELNRKPPLAPSASKVRDEILERIEEEKVLPKFDGNEVYFCAYMERFLMNVGNPGNCPTAAQMNRYLKSLDKSDHQLKELILASKKQWKTEKSFTNLVANHKKIWNKFHSCDIQKDFECEYDEMTSTFDSDSVMFATVIDHGIAKDGIFFRDKFYEANGNFSKVIKELREKFGASLRGNPRIEVKENK